MDRRLALQAPAIRGGTPRSRPAAPDRPALAWELELVEACLRAIPDFVNRHMQDDLAKEVFTVPVASGPLRLGLVEASQNRIGTAVDQVLLFCFHYDPTAGRYGAAVMNFVRLGGVLTVIGLGGLFAGLRRGERRRRSHDAAPPVVPSDGEVAGWRGCDV